VSLTSFIEEDDVWAYLGDKIPKPMTLRPKTLVAPARSKNNSIVGTAFDYLLRWYLQATHPRAKCRETWVAEEVIEMIGGRRRRIAETTVATARRRHQRALSTHRIGADLARSAVELARLDTVFRCGLGEEAIGTRVSANDIADLLHLLSVVPRAAFLSARTCLLNPEFNAADVVGGADADLVVGDMLVEVKVTGDNKITKLYFNQLIGYVLLYRLGGFAGIRRQPKVRRIGVYMARYGELITWTLADIAAEETFAKAAAWFKRRGSSNQ
jgi:hypothetical protein